MYALLSVPLPLVRQPRHTRRSLDAMDAWFTGKMRGDAKKSEIELMVERRAHPLVFDAPTAPGLNPTAPGARWVADMS